MMMLNLVMLILSNKKKDILEAALDVIYIPTVLLIIFTILLLKLLLLLHLQYYYYCFLVQWTTQMVTILESRCPIFISMKPITTTLNSYNNKIRQTQPNKYNNTTTNSTFSTTPTRALSRSDSDYYYHFALTKPSCTPMIIGLIKTTPAHSLQRQSTYYSDDNNDENENCTNPTQKTTKKKQTKSNINGLISATKISMMIKMMKAKKYYYFLTIFFQNPQFNLFSSFRLSFSQKNTTNLMLDTCTKKLRCLKL